MRHTAHSCVCLTVPTAWPHVCLPTCSETKERQWRRPDNNTRKSARLTEAPVRANEDASLAAVGDLQKNRRASRRFKGKETPAYLTEEQGGSMSNKAAAKVTLARKQSQAILEAEAVEEEKRNTVSFLCRIGTQNKKGYLLKQSKFIGRYGVVRLCLPFWQPYERTTFI